MPNTPPDDTDRDVPSTDGGLLRIQQRRRAWQRLLRTTLLLAGPILVVAVAGYLYMTGGRYVGTDNAYVKATTVMVAAQVSGLIVDVPVRENQHVEAGDVLFRIDDRPYRIALREADADLASVANEIASLKAEYVQKLEERALAEADLAYAGREFDRQTKLLATSTTSHSKYDASRHEVAVVRQRIRVIEQESAQIRARLGGDPEVPVTEHPSYLKELASEDRARLDLERTVVRAPFAGIASNVPELGEQVLGSPSARSPVMSVVADSNAWIEANFKETDLTHVAPGQAVTIHVDTYPEHHWTGVVESISQASGAEFSIIPPQNATGNWVKVVQRIPVRVAIDANGEGPALRAGMSTSVEIDTGRSRPMPAFVHTALSWLGVPAPALASSPEPAR